MAVKKRRSRSKPKKKNHVLVRLAKYILLAIVLGMMAIVTLMVVLMFYYSTPNAHPQSTLMIYHKLMGKKVERVWANYEGINPVLVFSVVMGEDAKFCNHQGVDWEALHASVSRTLDGEKSRGASTLSMQTVKNLFLWHGRSYLRKGLEIPLAIMADHILGKKRLVEIYLNIAEWDKGIFGIGAASKHYFDTKPAYLNARQSALLAVSLPNPIVRNPRKPSSTLRKLAKLNAKKAYQSGAYVQCLR